MVALRPPGLEEFGTVALGLIPGLVYSFFSWLSREGKEEGGKYGLGKECNSVPYTQLSAGITAFFGMTITPSRIV